MVRRDVIRETPRRTPQPIFDPYLESGLRCMMVGEAATSSALRLEERNADDRAEIAFFASLLRIAGNVSFAFR